MVTLEKAKEILGDTAKDMPDEKIVDVVEHLYKFANFIIDRYLEMTPEERKGFAEKTKNKNSP